MIEDNLKELQERINVACRKAKRNAQEITLICVTKTVGIEEIKELFDYGVSDIGENYVQDALGKFKQLKDSRPESRINWHMVGHLQKNKAKYAVELFNLIHSVDSFDLAAELNRCAQRTDRVTDILIQVNTSGEVSKFGVSPRELGDLVNNLSNLENLRIKGLMTIAPFNSDPEASRPYFKKLRQLKEEVNKLLPSIGCSALTTLSMGMTRDFEVAIEEGADMLRIGRAIFSER